MRSWPKFAAPLLLCGAVFCAALGQDDDYRHTQPSPQSQSVAAKQDKDGDPTLTEDDRLSIIAAALDSRVRHSERDCSHLVHAIYEQAGLPYSYAPSSEIYAGIGDFQRVKRPEPGDLIVWRGHVGIIIKPSQHIFFSYLRSGAGIDDYTAPYWKKRGRPRYYRYVRNDSCKECDRAPSHRLVKIKR
jgi:cell wall-associated NlpC family hydrolase